MSANEPACNRALALAEAAAWRIRLTEADIESTPEFEAWLTLPGHAEAWAQVSAPWDYLGERASEPLLVAARQTALGHARRAHAQRRPFAWHKLANIVAATLLLAIGLWTGFAWLNAPNDYATAFGERRVITLADGSHVSLDSDSEVTVRYTKTARELHLLKGQARFDVAHNVERPFSVRAGDQKVIATGTAFNIDITGPKVLVTLIEGHVVVLDEAAPAPRATNLSAPSPMYRSVTLEPGQQLAALPEKTPEIVPANIQRVTAWTSGQLMFDNQTLADVVAQVNHYSTTQIVITDPKVASMRISGVFNTGDVSGFIDTVTHYLPVQANETAAGGISLDQKG